MARCQGRAQHGQGTFYHADALGSVKALTNDAGSTTDRYEYGAFGNLARTVREADSYRYAGEYFDNVVGLQYNRARWYDPDSSRFVSIDPFEGKLGYPISLNKYVYAVNSPIDHVDPSGLFIGVASISIDSVSGAYARMANANSAYHKFDSIRQSVCKGVDRVGDVIDGHHLIPKYIGGKERQDLMFLSPSIHRALHGMLQMAFVANGFPFANKGRKEFEKYLRANPGKSGIRNQVVLDVAGYMDRMCVGVRGYDPIQPAVERVLRVADVFDF